MNMHKDSWQQFVRTMLIVMSILLIPVAEAVAENRLLFPGEREVFEKPINEWTAEWWQYILSIPPGVNPLLDPTGTGCALVQHGPVWFLEGVNSQLSGDHATRTCSIPEGRVLFFPLLNIVDFNVSNQSVKELRQEIAGCMDAASNLSLDLDGRSIPVGARSRVRSAPFAVVLPENSFFAGTLPAGVYSPAVDDGFYVMLKPLAVGAHTLHFTGSSPGCHYGPTDFHVDPFAVDVTYHLTVEAVSLK
jgi:hypothetical protein